MARIGVRVNNFGELCLLEPSDITVSYGDYVVYDSEEGMNCSKCIILPSTFLIEKGNIPSVNFIRIATEADHKQMADKEQQEAKAYAVCKEKIVYHSLPMKLIKTCYNFDFSRLTFFFSANGYVDFRNLLKDLTAAFRKTRIMLRQIGVRDEACLIGGVGPCGKELCCSTFLKEFSSITLKLAKDQGLPLNPNKISGVCGRLMCCLNYEQYFYEEAKSKMPEIGSMIETEHGKGKVVGQLVLKNALQVELADSKVIEVPFNEPKTE